jgi:hypothetical protein
LKLLVQLLCTVSYFRFILLHPNIIQVIKLRRVRWAGRIECRGEGRDSYRILVARTLKKRDRLKDLGVDGRIMLK